MTTPLMREASGLSLWTRWRIWRTHRHLRKAQRDLLRAQGCVRRSQPWLGSIWKPSQRQFDGEFWALIHRHDWLQYDPPEGRDQQ